MGLGLWIRPINVKIVELNINYSEYSFYHPELVRVGHSLGVEYPLVIDTIQAHEPRAMDYPAIANEYAHMGYYALLVVEEGQVAGLHHADKIDRFANVNLLASIARYIDADHFEKDLRKARTVDPE
jgi:hypothetical protein